MHEVESRQAMQTLGQIEQAVSSGDLALAQALAARLRPLAVELGQLVLDRQGEAAQRGFFKRLFKLGVFDQPPITGPAYSAWRALTRPNLEAVPDPDQLAHRPLLSVLMPVYQPDLDWLAQAANSVLSQTYPNFELCIADDNSPDPAVRRYLERLQASDPRVKCAFREQNGHISAATNSALALAEGDWCLLLDQDDLLAKNALAWLAHYLDETPAEVGVLFSDEDKLDEDDPSTLCSPLFKPGFDPDLLLACNCVSHLGVYRTSLLREIGGLRQGFEGAQDHDLCLRLLAGHGPGLFRHIPQIMYHWRQHQNSTAMNQDRKPYVAANALKSKQDYARALRDKHPKQSEILFSPRPDSAFSDVSFALPEPKPSLSVLVLAHEFFTTLPPDEQTAWLADLARNLAAYGGSQLFLVDPRGLAGPLPDLAADHGFAYIRGSGESPLQLLNQSAALAEGEALIMLRAGDLPLSDHWAGELVGAIWRDGVAVAGCRTINERNFIIQAGYALSRPPLPLGVSAGGPAERPDCRLWLCPAYSGLHLESPGYYHFAHLLHCVLSADLSGFCCKRGLFLDLGGFKPTLDKLAPTDFCLRALDGRNLRSLILPRADLRSRHGPQILPLTGDFADTWQNRLLAAPPWQNPALDWTPGGWRLAHSFADNYVCD